MATALVILAVGAVLAGYVGVPHALGGSNRIESFLEPSFHPAAFATGGQSPAHTVEAAHGESAASAAAGLARRPAKGSRLGAHEGAPAHVRRRLLRRTAGQRSRERTTRARRRLEFTLMAVSVALALAGIGLATLFFKSQPERADRHGGLASPGCTSCC